MAYRFTPADRGAFKRCRRQWDFGARERQNLEPAEAATSDLELAVRDALAVYYFPGMWDWQRSVVLPLVLQGLARSLGGQAAAAGDLAAGRALLERYFQWAPGVDRFSPVQVETRFEVNLPDPAGGDRELVLDDGRPIRYQGRVDLLAGDEHDRYWVVAHRLVDRFGAAEDLVLDEELVAACWAMERFYPGMRIAGTIHNEIRRANLPVGTRWIVGRGPTPSSRFFLVGAKEQDYLCPAEGRGWMVLAAHKNEVTERGRRRVVGALLAGAVLLVLYWAAWLLDRSLLASDTRPAYYEFEAAFALADGWLLASASTGPATHQAAVYRRPIDDPQRPFEPCAGESDLPAMFPHNIDTFCLVAAGNHAAVGERYGRVYLSEDAGQSWRKLADALPGVHCLAFAS
jgi:hypothetical protein